MLPLLAGSLAHAHVPVVYITGPTEDWCAVINGTIGNDLVMLEPGTYQGPCDIVAEISDVDYELTTVQSWDPNDPPVFVPGAADYVLSVSGHRLVLFQLEFADLPEGVDAVRVDDIRELWVSRSWFRRLPSAAVRARGSVVERLVVADNEFTDVGVAFELGCPDGSCAVGRFETEDNLVTRAGLGFVAGPGSPGTMTDDVMVDTPTAVRLLGGGQVTVDRGLYAGSGPVVDVLAGPALVRSSVVIGSSVAVRAAGEDLRDVALVGDSVIGGEGVALDLAGWGPGRDLRVVSTAVDEPLPAVDGVDLAGSIACEDPAMCFTDVAAWDLYPAPGSPLRDAGVADPELGSDWCGRVRLDPPCVGALEAFTDLTLAPLAPIAKDDFDCSFLEDVGDTGVDTDPGGGAATGGPSGGGERAPEGCGCASGGGAGPVFAVGLLALLAGRRAPVGARRSARRCC